MVLSMVIVLVGGVSLATLPVAQFPEVSPPTVTISATYPGASAEVMSDVVAGPIEEQVNGTEGMLYMSATSGTGSASITVTLDIGTDPADATVDINNRVRLAEPRLPEEVRRLGVVVRERSTNIVLIASLLSPDGRHSAVELTNYAQLNVIDELKRIPGVGDASLFGTQNYAMRIWIQPDLMRQYALTTSDIAAAIGEQNSQFAAGQIGAPPNDGKVPFTYTVTTKGRLLETSEFEDIVLRANPDGSLLRLKDVARVELGAQGYDFIGKVNGQTAVNMGVYLQSGANALDVASAVRARMNELAQRFPEGMQYTIPFDTTVFIEVSVKEVVMTLIEATLLVLLVVFLFLQNWRATVIPMLAVPVSLIGTFAGMLALGFTVNTLTLLGLVLAIGIVVDDAIVVLENVERIMRDEGLSPHDATVKAMEEVSGPIVAIVLVLAAVFIPAAFIGGITGQLYRQFAITIAISVGISGLVALTLSPALCAIMLKPERREPRGFFRYFNRGFDWLTDRYTAGVAFFIRRSVLALVLFGGMIALTAGLFRAVPTSFVPAEDQGVFFASIRLPDASALARTEEVSDRVVRIAMDNPHVESVVQLVGFDLLGGGLNSATATLFIGLKHWDQRTAPGADVHSLIPWFFAQTAAIKEAIVLAFNPPPIPGLGATGGFEAHIQSRGGANSLEIAQATQKLVDAANQRPELSGVSTQFRAMVPQLYVDVDRERVKAYGVPLNHIFDSLQTILGALYVNDFNAFGRTYRVQLQAEAPYRSQPEDIGRIHVRSSAGEMIPLASMIQVDRVTGAGQVERFNGFPSARVIGNAAPGHSSGEALSAIEATTAEVLPPDYAVAWGGVSFQERQAGGTGTLVFGFALVIVFLVLAAQYERWSLPIAVLLAVPFGLFGAMLAVWLRGLDNDVYLQISLLTLLGLSAKNAILIVEFAAESAAKGVPVERAAMEGARLRFRPVVMTSLAFIFGVLPLAIASGAGAGSRHSIGTGVVGGMLAATAIAILFVPLFYKLMAGRRRGSPDAALGADAPSHENEP